MNMNIRKMMQVAALVGLSGATFARDAKFMISDSYFDVKWNQTEYNGRQTWQDDYVPMSPGDVVSLGDAQNPPKIGNGQFRPVNDTAFEIDSIVYGPYLVRLLFTSQNAGMTLREASNCYSTWNPTVAGVTFKKVPNSEGELVFRKMVGGYGPVFKTEAAEDKIRISDLYGQGLVTKRGAGELILDKPTGERQIVNLHEGSLTIGSDMACFECNEPATNSFVRFDASKTNSIETVEGADGRIYVTKWTNIGNSQYYAFSEDDNRRPFLSSEKVNGVALVDFGACSSIDGDVEKYGPPGYLMMGAGFPSGIKEVFQVVQANSIGVSDMGPLCGNWYNDHFLASTEATTLFKYDGQAKDFMAKCNGRLNGMPFAGVANANEYRDPQRLAVISSWDDGSYADLGDWWYLCRRYNDSRCGGLKVAEIITYDRVLTEVERRRTIQYLRRKWFGQTDRKVYDVGIVAVRGASTAVNVAADSHAEVRAVRVQDAAHAFVKTGEGELAVEQIYPENAEIKVDGGKLVFENSAEPATDPQPASDPYLHADATVSASLIHTQDTQGQPLDSLEMWNDCRVGVTVCLTNAVVDGVALEKPYVTANAMNGNPAVDFGTSFTETGARFAVLDRSGAAVPPFADAFIVWKSLTGDPEHEKAPGFFGFSDWSFRRSDQHNIAGSMFDVDAHARIDSALYTIDGMPAIRDADGYKLGLEDPVVLGVDFPYPQQINRIGATSPGWKGGGIRIAEVLLYDRRLSETERRNTEAYLLKKWRGVDVHPAYRTTVGKLSFSENAVAEIAVENGSRTFGSVESESGSIVKGGAGEAEVKSLSSGVKSLAANEGTLSVTAETSVEDLLSTSSFHADATAWGSLVTEVKGGVTYVSRVNHAEGASDNYATLIPESVKKLSVVNKPKLAQVEINGRTKAVFDFGDFISVQQDTDGVYQLGDSNASGFQVPGWLKTKEFYVVVRDTDPERRKSIFSTWEYYLDRGANGAMFSDGVHGVFTHPYWLDVDGEEKLYTDVMDDGWHVLCFSSESLADLPPVTWFGCQTAPNEGFALGGQQVAEMILFDENHAHSAEERQLIRDYLRWKWLGETDGIPKVVDALRAETGATLRYQVSSPHGNLVVKSLAGGGTIDLNGASASGISEIACTIGADGAVSCLAVDGAITFADTGTVRITVGDPKLKAGVYPIFTAQSIANPLAVRGWTLDLSAPLRRTARLVVRDNAVCLEVMASGLCIMIQ